MAVQFSFTERQWWASVAAVVLIVVLLVAVGFLSGALWQRRRGAVPAATGSSSHAGSVKKTATTFAGDVRDTDIERL